MRNRKTSVFDIDYSVSSLEDLFSHLPFKSFRLANLSKLTIKTPLVYSSFF